METIDMESANTSACFQLQQILKLNNQLIQNSPQLSLEENSMPSWDETNCSILLNEFESSDFIEDLLEFPYYIRSTATIVCTIVLILGTTGNLLVPIVVIKTKELRNSTNLFLINLSIADLLVLIVCMPTVLIELITKPEIWHLGEWMCKAVPFVEMVVQSLEVLTILAISFERYYAICKPLKASYKCTMHRAIVIIILLWTVAFIATIPVLFGTELSQARYIDGSLVSVCLTKANTNWQKIYFLASMTAFFWAPLCILLVIYSVITKRLILDDRITCNTDGRITCNSEHIQMRARRQVVFMLAAVVTCFFICLLPFRLLTLWLIIASEDQIKQLSMETFYNILYFCRIMLYINSMLNPCLYAVVSSKFRNAFMIVLCCRRRNRLLIRHSTFNTTTSSVVMSSLKNSITKSVHQTSTCATIHNQVTPLVSSNSLKTSLFEPKYCDINEKTVNCNVEEKSDPNIDGCLPLETSALKTMSSEESYV